MVEAKKSLELEGVKKAIKVDFPDDDDFIALLMEASIEYLKFATGFDLKKSNSAKAIIYCYSFINECYKDRSLTSDQAGQKIRPVMQDILIQLSYHDDSEG